jgi:hypothetical protein
MDQVLEKHSKTSELRLYMEQLDTKEATFIKREENVPSASIMLFIKYYDPTVPSLRFVGRVTVKNKMQKVADIIPQICEMAKLPDSNVIIYEVHEKLLKI